MTNILSLKETNALWLAKLSSLGMDLCEMEQAGLTHQKTDFGSDTRQNRDW